MSTPPMCWQLQRTWWKSLPLGHFMSRSRARCELWHDLRPCVLSLPCLSLGVACHARSLASFVHHGHCRYFRTDRIEVQKRITPWSLYARWTGVNFEDLAALYQATAGAQGLVHAVGGPQLSADKYTVVLQPVGLPHTAATPLDEGDVQRVAHGVLHALAAIHAVRAMGWGPGTSLPVGLWSVVGCCALQYSCPAAAGQVCAPRPAVAQRGCQLRQVAMVRTSLRGLLSCGKWPNLTQGPSALTSIDLILHL